jgi:hypothetical protein
MRIFKHELKKIITTPVLIGFVLCCLLLNIALASGFPSDYANYIANVSHQTGYVLGAGFDERAANLDDGLYASGLRRETKGMTNVFDGYTTGYIADAYVHTFSLSGMTEWLMRDKYERLQYVVDDLHESGAGMTLYFAGATHDRHTQLFRMVMVVLLWQGILLGALITLFSLGYEHHAKTDAVAYATKTGRRITHAKLAASLVASLAVYTLIATVTLGVYLTLNPFGGTWGSSVSSGFNFVRDLLVGGARPFITWHGFTIGGYLLAVLGISLALVLCFALMGYIAGLWIQNSYIGFLVAALVNFAIFTLNPGNFLGMDFFPNYIFTSMPIWLVLDQGWWFTDGGTSHLWQHFETIGALASLLLLAVFGYISWQYFKRRNLT